MYHYYCTYFVTLHVSLSLYLFCYFTSSLVLQLWVFVFEINANILTDGKFWIFFRQVCPLKWSNIWLDYSWFNSLVIAGATPLWRHATLVPTSMAPKQIKCQDLLSVQNQIRKYRTPSQWRIRAEDRLSVLLAHFSLLSRRRSKSSTEHYNDHQSACISSNHSYMTTG